MYYKGHPIITVSGRDGGFSFYITQSPFIDACIWPPNYSYKTPQLYLTLHYQNRNECQFVPASGHGNKTWYTLSPRRVFILCLGTHNPIVCRNNLSRPTSSRNHKYPMKQEPNPTSYNRFKVQEPRTTPPVRNHGEPRCLIPRRWSGRYLDGRWIEPFKEADALPKDSLSRRVHSLVTAALRAERKLQPDLLLLSKLSQSASNRPRWWLQQASQRLFLVLDHSRPHVMLSIVLKCIEETSAK